MESGGRCLGRGHWSRSLQGEEAAFPGSRGEEEAEAWPGLESMRRLAVDLGRLRAAGAGKDVGGAQERGICRGRQAQHEPEPAEVFK